MVNYSITYGVDYFIPAIAFVVFDQLDLNITDGMADLWLTVIKAVKTTMDVGISTMKPNRIKRLALRYFISDAEYGSPPLFVQTMRTIMPNKIISGDKFYE